MDVTNITNAPNAVVDALDELLASEAVQTLVHRGPADSMESGQVRAANLKAADVRADFGGRRMDNLIETLRMAQLQGRKLPTREVNEALQELANCGYSEQAQEEFVRFLRKKLALAEGKQTLPSESIELAKVLERMRPALPGKKFSLSVLARFFRDQGFRLRRFDPEPDRTISKHADLLLARETLRPFQGQARPMTKRDIRHYLSLFSSTVDRSDLRWGFWRLQGRVQTGSIEFNSREARETFHSFFNDRLDDEACHRNSLHLHARGLRASIEGGCDAHRITETLSQFLRETDRFHQEPDALFFAKRVLDREMNKARPENPELVALVETTTTAFFAQRLDGKLDWYSERHRIRKLVASGVVSKLDSWRMLAAVSTCCIETEYRNIICEMRLELRQRLLEMYSEVMETLNENIRRAGSNDILDSDGNVIVSALELHLERLERERAILQQTVSDREFSMLGERVRLDSQISAAVGIYLAAKSPSERAAAAANLARFLSARDDLEPLE